MLAWTTCTSTCPAVYTYLLTYTYNLKPYCAYLLSYNPTTNYLLNLLYFSTVRCPLHSLPQAPSHMLVRHTRSNHPVVEVRVSGKDVCACG